jgi:two-component system, response regulator
MTDDVRILLVEDNPNDVKLALHAFKKHKLANHVHVARDGAEALEFIFCTGTYAHRQIADGPRLILLDLKLPLVDGVEVLRRIKGDPRTQSIPVVILTSSREQCDIVDSYRLGVNSYIVKPVDFEQFTDSVQQLGFYWLLLNQAPFIGTSIDETCSFSDPERSALTGRDTEPSSHEGHQSGDPDCDSLCRRSSTAVPASILFDPIRT